LVFFWRHWLALVLGAFLFLAWSALSLPTTFTVVATSLEARRHTMGIGVQSMVRRVPMMLGPLFGGWLVERYGWASGVRWALLICIVLGLLTMIFQWFMVDPFGPGPGTNTLPDSSPERTPGPAHPTQRHSLEGAGAVSSAPGSAAAVGLREIVLSFTPALRELLVSDILIRFCERIPSAFVILWAMNHSGLDAQQFSYLVAIEMLTAMVCYIPVAHLADKYGRRPFVLMTFLFFTLFPVTLLWANNFLWLALAFAVRGLKEFGEPARKALIIGEAAPAVRSRTFGAYYLIRDCVVTSGSFLGAWLWSINPRANFIGAAACGALGTVWFWWFVYRRSSYPRAG
jgi:MFS family permease